MKSLILALLCLGLNSVQAQPDAKGESQQKQAQDKSAINMPALEDEAEAQELNTAPTPIPNQSESEKFPGTLSTGESFRLGPYDREGNYIHKQSPEVEEAQEAVEAQEEKQEEMERVHGEELLDFSTTPQQEER